MSFSRRICGYRRLAVIALITAAIALPRAAAAAEDGWKFRLHGTWTNSGGSLSLGVPVGFGISVGSGSSAGIGAALEYRLSPWVGVEASVQYTRMDLVGIRAQFFSIRSTSGSRSYVPISAALNLYPLRKDSVELYVGPMLTYSIFGDASGSTDGLEVSRHSSGFGFGAQVGVDVSLGSGEWGLGGAVKYTAADADIEALIPFSLETNINPVTVTAGVRYRF